MITLNEVQFEKQIEIANSVLSYAGNCYIDVFPRVGKTLISFIIASKTKDVKNTIIVVPNNDLKKDMQSALNESYFYIKEFIFNRNIEIYTKKELMEFNVICSSDKKYDLIIDEIHKYSTDNGFDTLAKYAMMPHVKIIGMTGTPNEVPIILNLHKSFRFTEEEAIDFEFIANHKEYAIPLQLNYSEQELYFNYSSLISETLSLLKDVHKASGFKDALECLYSCARGKVVDGVYKKGGAISMQVALNAGWSANLDISNAYNANLNVNFNPNNLHENCKKATAFIDRRNDLIFNNIIKVNKVVELLQSCEGSTIIFTGTKKLAELIYTSLNSVKVGIIYSNMPTRLMKDLKGDYITNKDGTPKKIGTVRQKSIILERLKNEQINVLITPESLQEGFTEKTINNVIICNGSSNPITDTQRKARGKTKNDNKIVNIYNLFFDDFMYGIDIIKNRDKVKFESRVNNLDEIIFI